MSVQIIKVTEIANWEITSIFLNNEFEVENSLSVIENIKGLTPYGEFNRHSAIMSRLDSLNKIFGLKPHNIDIEKLIENIDGITETAEIFTEKIEEFIYAYIEFAVLGSKVGVQEYIIARARKRKSALLRNAKIRISNIHKIALIIKAYFNLLKYGH